MCVGVYVNLMTSACVFTFSNFRATPPCHYEYEFFNNRSLKVAGTLTSITYTCATPLSLFSLSPFPGMTGLEQ